MAKQGLNRVAPSMLLWAVVVLLCGVCVVDVVAQVQLGEGTTLHNQHDPVQYKDCDQLHRAGYNVSGAHVLYVNKTSPFLIHCEFTKYQAYNVIQRRSDYSVNFMQMLQVYQKGFGNAHSDYWAGLDQIVHLTSTGNNVLTINMQNNYGQNKNARYSHFMVYDHTRKYQMTVAGFSGSPGLIDEMSPNSGMYFTTYDFPDQNKCATHMRAGWWYNYCTNAMPNGYYYPPGTYVQQGGFYDGVFWKSFGGFDSSLKFISMSVSSS